MNAALKLNPELAVWFEVEGDRIQAIRLEAPTPGVGLQSHLLTPLDEPLFRTVADLATNEGDVDSALLSLAPDQVERLREMAILVAPEAAPHDVYYSCYLEEGCAWQAAPPDVVVNPTLRYDADGLPQDGGFLAGVPVVWLAGPFTTLTLPYWLSDSYEGTLARLQPGQPPGALPPAVAADLYAQGVLVRPAVWAAGQRDWHRRLEEARAGFQGRGWSILRGLMPRPHRAALQMYHAVLIEEGFLTFGDGQVPRRWRMHNEPLARFLHWQLQPVMEAMVGAEVRSSYVYTASYREGAVLAPHQDREQCEYSISLQIDYRPEVVSGPTPWPLYLQTAGNEPSPAYLGVGDGLFYKGRELTHFRSALEPGHESTSLFFHYVPAHYDGSLD